MKHYFFPLLKSLCITLGLDGALLGYIALLTLLVEEPFFQVILFFCVTVCPIVAVCLYANIHAEKRRTLWLCAAVSLSLHLCLSLGAVVLYGFIMAAVWASDLAPILIMLMACVPWLVAVLAITVVRSARIGRAKRENNRQLRRIAKGLIRADVPVSSFRSGFGAVCRGLLWAAGLHLSTGLLFLLLEKLGIADTMLSYVAFPVLWCLYAAAYGLFDRPRRLFYGLGVGIGHLSLSVGTVIWLFAVYAIRYGTKAWPLTDLFSVPFFFPEALIFGTVFWIGVITAMVFILGRGRKKA